ncbi:MAG: winged helix-turn-helix domain-containing protein, partial [Woeseiaceae bacterium]|nr:winged helix-turn-helix domain-containing protein [Woeseiaceae bacterium]
MSPDLEQGFRYRSWTVEPLRGAVTGPDGQTHHLEPKVMEVFLCLAEHADTLVSRDALLDAAWPGQAVTDEPLTRVIGELRRALGDDRGTQSVIETVPKRGYRLIGAVEPLSADGESPSPNGRSPGIVFAFVLGAVAAVALTYQLLEDGEPAPVAAPIAGDASAPSAGPSRRSVAVLPFRNRSAAEDDAYFVDGIHDDLVTQLARIASIDKVISRTTMEQYRDTDKSMPEIARELGVGTILEGGVQRAGDSVRINVQLIDAVNDRHLWAETFDRQTTAENIFALQSEIAEAVAGALQLSVTAADQQRIRAAPTQNLTALEYYFRARDRMVRRTTEAIDEAVAFLESAIEIDPEFALAYVTLARAMHLRAFYGGLSLEDEYGKARALIDRALEIDGRSDDAYAVLGGLEIGFDSAAAEDALQIALELNPAHPVATHEYCDLLGPWFGRHDEALPVCERAVAIDPLSPIRHIVLGQTLSGLGRHDEAEAAFRRSIELDDGFSYGYANLGFHYRYSKGQAHEAVRWFRRSIELDPGSTVIMAALGNTYVDLGDLEQAEAWIELAHRLAPENGETNASLALLHAARGDYEAAADSARKVLEFALPEFAGYAIAPIRDHLIRQDRIDEARDFVAATYPELLSPDVAITPANWWPALDLGFVLKQTGEQEQAKRILEALLRDLESSTRLTPFWGYAII